ncbi:MAG: ATP-binding protein, partial [Candidatus Hydrogenedentales bacterium]
MTPGDGGVTGLGISFGEQIVSMLSAGVIAVDSTGRIISVNPAAQKHLNIEPERLQVGTRMVGIPELEPFVNILEEVLASGSPLSRREVTIGTQPWSQKDIGLSVSLLAGKQHCEGAIFLFTDMTERRRLERAASVNEQLANLGELAAGVVHELRNPLTIIRGRAELIARSTMEDRELESARAILDEVRHLEKTINQFLRFAKPFSLQPARCDAQEVVDRALALNREKATDKSVQLHFQLAETPQPMTADKARLAEALGNLLGNAIEAVEEGGHVGIRVEQASNMTRFEVKDDGPGVWPEEGEDLFSPFFSKKHNGTGLGL